MYAEDVLGSPTIMPDGTRAGWLFVAPSGTAISAISYYRTLAADGSRHMSALLAMADGAILDQCKIEIPLGSPIDCYKPNNQVPFVFTGLNTSSLFFGVVCHVVFTDGGGCTAGGTIHSARAAMYSARVTLIENSVPVVGDVGGPLWGGGVVSGVVPVTFAASDPSGIKGLLVRSESGRTVALVPQACDFTLAQPCPQLPAGSLGVDTTRVPDGPHSFSLVVSDAAENRQVVTSVPVVVDNNGPPPPLAFTAMSGAPGSNVVVLSWRNPVGAPVAVTGAVAQLCQATCEAATGVAASGAAQLTAPGPGVYGVRLWLVDAHGRGGPQNAALAGVTVAAPTATARPPIAAVLRGRRLRVSATIASSGRVRVSWRSKIGARTVGHGSRVVTIRVQRIGVTFVPSRRARSRRARIRVVIRSGSRVIAHATARRG